MLTRGGAGTGAARASTCSSSTPRLGGNGIQQACFFSYIYTRVRRSTPSCKAAAIISDSVPSKHTTSGSAPLGQPCLQHRHVVQPVGVTRRPPRIVPKSTIGDVPTSGNGNIESNGPSGSSSGSNAGGSSSSGNGGGSNRPPWSKPSQPNGDGSSSSKGPASLMLLPFGGFILGLVLMGSSLLSNIFRTGQLRKTAKLQAEQLEDLSAVISGSTGSLGIKDSFAAVKRLLREVFAEQLGIKQRLESLEKTAAEEPEAADYYQSQVSGASSSRSWSRSPVRVTGFCTAAGILPWSQESSATEALSTLSALGASGHADGRLQLHSVLAGGKRRVTAEISQAAIDHDSGTPLLQLTKLLYRVQLKNSIQLLIAPLGGSLDAVSKSVTPIQADYGCSQAMRRGHGLSVFDYTGSGKAAAISQGALSAAAGFFVGGGEKTSLAQLQLKGQDGHSISIVAAHCRFGYHSSDSSDTCNSSSGSGQPPGMRWLGVQAPGTKLVKDAAASNGSEASSSSTVIGAAGVLPIRDSLTATAWAEKPSGGAAGWGLGLYTQPDPDGLEVGMVLGRPSSHHKAFRAASAPVFCELTAKVPVGEGLSISPGALVTCGESRKVTLAYLIQSSWRF